MTNTRTNNVRRNLIYNLVKYGLDIIFKFVLRTVLIYYMGAQYIGLNGLFGNIFTFLNLADLGIGSAIVFSMYKPIAEGDTEKVKALQNLYKKYYMIIGIVILVLGGAITPFIKYFIKGTTPADINIYILFVMYIVNAVCGYLFAHKRSLLFAYQRNDIENKIKSVCTILMSALQVAAIVLFKNYYIFFAINIVFTTLDSIWIYIIANKHYPDINGPANELDADTRVEIRKNVVALSMHKIGGAVVFSTDNILISAFVGLTVLGAYSNYALIISALTALFGLIYVSLGSSVGNMIASCDTEYCYKRFRFVNYIFTLLTSFSTICLFVLVQPFITVWTSYNPEYLLDNTTVVLICISLFLSRMRQGVMVFKDSAGLFRQDMWKPIAEAGVNLVASIVLAKYMGINGIILGTIISTVVAPLWVEPLVLYKHYFHKSVYKYFTRYAIDTIIMLGVGAACYYICALLPTGGLGHLILRFGVCGMLCGGLLILAYLVTPECRQLFSMVGNRLKEIKGKMARKKHD